MSSSNSDINYKGSFATIEAVWTAYPYGGVEGDYLLVNNVKYRWNKYVGKWENAEVVTDTPARSVTTFDGDVNAQNNLTVAGVLRAKKFVVDNLPTGIESVEVTESAVSGGNNVIVITYTNGNTQTFNIKNGAAGKTEAAFAIAADALDKTGWDTAKCYLVLTENEGEFDVYSYEAETWSKIDTIEIDLNYDIDDTLSTYSEKPVQNMVITKEINNTNAYVKDVRVLAVGQVYYQDEAVVTADGAMGRMTKKVKTLTTTDAITTGDLVVYNGGTYKAKKDIVEFDEEGQYSIGDYSIKDDVIKIYNGSIWSAVTTANMTVDNNLFDSVDADAILNYVSQNSAVQDFNFQTRIEYVSPLSSYANSAKSNGFPQNPTAASNPNKWVQSENYYGYWFNVTAYVGKVLRFRNTVLAANAPFGYFFDKIITTDKADYRPNQLSAKFIVPIDGSFIDVLIPEPNSTGKVYLWILTQYNGSNIYNRADMSLVKTIKDMYGELSSVREGNVYHTMQLDTTSMTKTARSLGSDDKWLNNNGCNHVVIPCNEGDTFVISNTSEGTGSFYGWLTSAYVAPTSASAIPYVRSSSTRIWMAEDTTNTITAPPDAAYLCLVTKDGSGQVAIWTGTMRRNQLLDDVLNNELKGEILNEVSEGIGRYVMQPSSYIPLKEGATKLMNISGQQGSAFYGDYLAVWYLGNKLNIYDVRNKTSVATNVSLPSFGNSRLHANTMSFGLKYDNSDPLPLLYICSGYTDTDSVSTSEVYVVRITESGGTYSTSLIQTITLDFGRINGWTEFVVDPVKSRAWINGCPTASYICVALPDTSNSAVTIDNTTTIVDKFNVKAPKVFGTSTASSGQGRFFWHNRVYYVSGVPSYDGQGEDSLYLIVDNCITHCTEAVVALKNFGLASGTSNTYEPEGCFIWEDEMYIVYRTFVYKLERN